MRAAHPKLGPDPGCGRSEQRAREHLSGRFAPLGFCVQFRDLCGDLRLRRLNQSRRSGSGFGVVACWGVVMLVAFDTGAVSPS